MASYANGMWTFTAPNCPNCVRTRTAQGFPDVPEAEFGELCALCKPTPWMERSSGVTSSSEVVPATVPDVDMEAVAAAVAGVFEAPVEAAAEPMAEAAVAVEAAQVDVEVQ